MSRVWRRRAWKGVGRVDSGDVGALEGKCETSRDASYLIVVIDAGGGDKGSQGSQGGYRHTLVWRDGT